MLDDGNSDEYKEGSEKYIQIDPKITLAAFKAAHNLGGSASELRSMKWPPRYAYLKSSSRDNPKRYPKNIKIVHEYEPYPRKTAKRIVKHVIPAYEDDSGEPFDPSSEDYSERRPQKALKFIPASEVSQYIPTIPFSALNEAQSQFKPMWTSASESTSSKSARTKLHSRPGRNSRFESSVRYYDSNHGIGDDSYSSPLIPSGSFIERRFFRGN